VVPDAFVTGCAVIPAGGSTFTVCLYVFDKAGKTKIFDAFDAELTSNLLVESGKDFLLPGAANKGRPKEGPLETVLARKDEALKSNENVEKALAPSPLKDKEAPVVLEVYYGSNRIDYQIDKATRIAAIPEPQTGQEVKLVICKTDDTNIRYGV